MGIHALRLLAGLCATLASGYTAVELAIEDAGGARDRLMENFCVIGEFLDTHGIDPHHNPGFVRDPVDEIAGEVQILVREWQQAKPLRLV